MSGKEKKFLKIMILLHFLGLNITKLYIQTNWHIDFALINQTRQALYPHGMPFRKMEGWITKN